MENPRAVVVVVMLTLRCHRNRCGLQRLSLGFLTEYAFQTCLKSSGSSKVLLLVDTVRLWTGSTRCESAVEKQRGDEAAPSIHSAHFSSLSVTATALSLHLPIPPSHFSLHLHQVLFHHLQPSHRILGTSSTILCYTPRGRRNPTGSLHQASVSAGLELLLPYRRLPSF